MLDIERIPSGWYRVAEACSDRATTGRAFGGVVRVSPSEDGFRATLDDRPLPTAALDGFVFAYFDEERVAPSFRPQAKFPAEGRWSRFSRHRFRARSHLLDISENAVDMAHFAPVHGYDGHAEIRNLVFDAQRFEVEFRAYRRLWGRRTPVDVHLAYQGLGLVHGFVRTRWLDVQVVYTPTPIDGSELDILLTASFRKGAFAPRDWLLSLLVPYQVQRDFEPDLEIWAHKRFLERPRLCAADGPVMQLRQWATQFYPARAVASS